jgi:hypothetical protein
VKGPDLANDLVGRIKLARDVTELPPAERLHNTDAFLSIFSQMSDPNGLLSNGLMIVA